MFDELSVFKTILEMRWNSNYKGGTPVGAALRSVNAIVYGWNRYPDGVDHVAINKLSRKNTRSHYAVHAEVDAILNASASGVTTKNGIMYVTRYPCVNCISSMVIAGIQEVHFLDEKPLDDDELDDRIFRFSGCNIRFFECRIEDGNKIYKRRLM